MTGLLGGFTTFSTYLLDFMVLLERQKNPEAFLYLFFQSDWESPPFWQE